MMTKVNSGTFRHDGIYCEWFFWWFPWGVTRWWLPGMFRGGDEWCNDSIIIKVPLLGALVLFWRKPFTGARTAPCAKEWKHINADQRADYAPCGWPYNGNTRPAGHQHMATGKVCADAQAWCDEYSEVVTGES